MTNPSVQTEEICRLCTCRLDPDENDDLEHEICNSCISRPEARHLGIPLAPPPLKVVGGTRRPKPAREFTVAEKGLIRKVHGYMPAQQLLSILNERLICDLGPDAMPYTMERLYAEIGDVAGAVAPAGGHDWASLRKLLSKARRDGVLGLITEQVINDFAVVYSLNQKQVLTLKDIVLQTEDEE